MGDDKSFVGEWSSNKKLWENFSQDIKDLLEADKQIDGQFLITFDEFFKNFERLTFVHTNIAAFASYDSHLNSRVEWITKIMRGSWVKGETAGGFGDNKYEDYFMNPQYLINLQTQNNFDDKVTAIFSLMQCDLTNNVNPELAKIEVFRLNENVPNKKKYIYSDLEQVYYFRGYKRELAIKLNLKPGNYVIIPSLSVKDKEGRFLIRVFIEGKEDVNFKGINLGAKKITKKEEELKREKEKEEESDDESDEYDEEYNDKCEDYNENKEIVIPEEYVNNIKMNSHSKKQKNSKACLIM